MSPVLPSEDTAKNAAQAPGPSKISWISRTGAWFPAAALVSLVGCAVESSDSAVEARVTAAGSAPDIFGGAKDDDGEAAPGVVALRVGTGTTFELCSGALVAPNIVLTARHCVTKNVTTSVSCDENGHSANGLHVSGNQEPSAIGVYVGANPNFARKPVSSARAVVAPTGPYLCNSDIALIVLETPIADVAPLPVRVRSTVRPGEMVRSVGFGQNDSASPIGTRFRKSGVAVLAQGKAVSPSATPLGTNEFEVGKSICRGDSGGPAISEETGAVIGVVSRGGRCDQDFGHVYTTTAGFAALFDDASKLAGTSLTLETSDRNVNTRSQLASSGALAGPDDSPSAGSCSIGRTGGRTGNTGKGAGTAGLALVMATLGALCRHRRREV